jgi:hypothetical protein
MQESDTYLAIIDEGQEKRVREFWNCPGGAAVSSQGARAPGTERPIPIHPRFCYMRD